MQTILDEPQTVGDLVVEIRSRWKSAPPCTVELRRLHLNPLGTSRVLRFVGEQGNLTSKQLAVLLDERLEEVVTSGNEAPGTYLDVFCLPGVTDAEGDMATLALQVAGFPGMHCRAGIRYRFDAPVPKDLRRAVERLAGNTLIHALRWNDDAAARITDDVPPGRTGLVGQIDLRNLPTGDLAAISREHGLALDGIEMRTVQAYFDALDRPATDVELQSIALAWSEHCSHKTFKATIEFEFDGRREVIPGLLRTCIAEPTRTINRRWVRSAFEDNAGVVAFDGHHDLAFKVETHNHPSALEPFGGAHTGVGGVIRDVLAVSAEPVANTDVLCFGPPNLPPEDVPAGSFHPRTTYREVVRGVADYGNNMGIPTVGGGVLFAAGFTANPLVYCGTLGLAPRDSHPRRPRPGDAIVVLGGRTGRDGLHGATMSSETLDRATVASSTVQIGAPITEKTLRDVIPRLRDERLYTAITDCGAGGLCSAVGEMGAELGIEVDLASVPLKYAGLSPWEIWLSEAQERMVLAVPGDSLPRVFQLCAAHDVEGTVIGAFRDDGQMVLRHAGDLVADIEMSLMHEGHPAPALQARWTTPVMVPYTATEPEDANASLLALLAHPNIASKEDVIRRYDFEVGAATVGKPLVGNAGPADAAVLKPLHHCMRGAVLAHGINPQWSAADPHAMAMLAVDEALRNLVAVGGSIDRAAVLDNFCWGDIDDPHELGGLTRAAQGCRDAALLFRTPFICGKDSLRNVSVDCTGRHSIPGTLLISALGVVPDIRQCIAMDLKAPGNALYILGTTEDELGGSHYLMLRGIEGGATPRVRPAETPGLMRRLTRAIRRGLVASCHDLSEGGLAVSAAEMALAGGWGVSLDCDAMPAGTSATEALLFGESPGRFLIEVAPAQAKAFETLCAGLPWARVGETTVEQRVVVTRDDRAAIDLPLAEIEGAWRTIV